MTSVGDAGWGVSVKAGDMTLALQTNNMNLTYERGNTKEEEALK